jgi:predicted nucleic acid-binding protein
MIYLDTAYIARLYFEDPGWEKVRTLAAQAPIGCCHHGYAETVAVIHRKFREGVLTAAQFRHTLDQFSLDCSEGAYIWLPLSEAVDTRVQRVYENLPRTVFLRASDALHLACAAENQLAEIYSNDRHLLTAASHFGLQGIDVIGPGGSPEVSSS